jgi:hypothetical protein
METFTPVSALLGGVLIGLSAVVLMASNGRIAGISGILGAALTTPRGDGAWRLAFLAGLIGAPVLFAGLTNTQLVVSFSATPMMLIIGGLLVGAGTQVGGGCTSGHGVCGNARLSMRSFVATLTFMATGAATVFVVRHVIGV